MKNMLRKILKKDLIRRKGINAILLLFIFLATMFLASSFNNIVVLSSGIDYFLDVSKIPDVSWFLSGVSDKEDVENWLDTLDGIEYEGDPLIVVKEKSVQCLKKTGENIVFDGKGANVFLGSCERKYSIAYTTENETFTLKNNEIAMPIEMVKYNNLDIGDTVSISVGEINKSFTLAYATKDAAFGSADMTGRTRLLVNEENFEALFNQKEININNSYNILTDDYNYLMKEINNKGFSSTMQVLQKSVFRIVYSMDMVMAALFILIGICLIFIALLVLRFTLVFTIEEDYREIGIMKAMGIRNINIRKIFMIKYAVLVLVGSILGLIVSFPVGDFMLNSVSEKMILSNSGLNGIFNIVSAIFIVISVNLFCYGCTRNINKFSVIEAIRGGGTGERFKRNRGLKLYSKKKMKTFVFLGINDIECNLKRYMVLLITFCISFVLISIPLNTLTTMSSSEMQSKLSLNPKGNIYVKGFDSDIVYSKELIEKNNYLSEKIEEIGYENSYSLLVFYFIGFYDVNNKDEVSSVVCAQYEGDCDYLTYSKGRAPVLENEIAFSEPILEMNNWEVGDRIGSIINGSEKEFIICGSYSDYLNVGNGARLNSSIDMSEVTMNSGFWSSFSLDTDKSEEEIYEILKEKLPNYEWSTKDMAIDSIIGNVRGVLEELVVPLTGFLCLIIMIITLLMEQLFIFREKGEIAMLKSIGFKNRTIGLWQVIRMTTVVLVSMIVAVPFSMLSNKIILSPIFKIMGADLNIQVEPFKAYLVFPAILLVGIIIATLLACTKIKNINIRELNNLE